MMRSLNLIPLQPEVLFIIKELSQYLRSQHSNILTIMRYRATSSRLIKNCYKALRDIILIISLIFCIKTTIFQLKLLILSLTSKD